MCSSFSKTICFLFVLLLTKINVKYGKTQNLIHFFSILFLKLREVNQYLKQYVLNGHSPLIFPIRINAAVANQDIQLF